VRRVHALLWFGGVALGLAAEWAAFGFGDLRHAVPDLLTGLDAARMWPDRLESRAGEPQRPAARGHRRRVVRGNFAGALLHLHRGPLVHVLLTDLSGRAGSRLDRAAVVLGYAAAVVAPVWDGEAMTLVLSAALGLVAVLGYRACVGPERRARAVSFAATEAVALVLVTGAAARLAFPAGDADEPALLAYQLALCAVAVALTSALVARTWERTALTDLVVDLGERRSGTLSDALARALGDPTL